MGGETSWLGTLIKARIVDDRGVARDVFDAFHRGAAKNAPDDPELAEIVARLRAVAGTGLAVPVTFVRVLVGTALVAVVIGGMVVVSWIPGLPPWSAFVVYYSGMLFFPAIWMQFTRRDRRKQIAKTLLGEGRCAACAFRLDGLQGAPDGCVVCPECSAAWLESRIVARAAQASSPRTLPDVPGVAREALGAWWLGWKFWPAIEDERGRAVRMIDPGALGKSPGKEDGAVDEKRGTGLRSWLRARTRFRRVWGLLALTVSGVGVTWLCLRVAGPGVSGLLAFCSGPICGAMFLLMGWRDWTGRSQRYAATSREVFLEWAVCPGCGGDLRGVGASTDGMTTCPGCRAVWRK